MAKRVYEIDGLRFSTLEGFFDEIDRVILRDAVWGRNLDAFNDILSGGFGTPNEGFVIRWLNSPASRERLGYDETVLVLERRLKSCHPSNRDRISRDLSQAKSCQGTTVFDWLVKIIKNHGPGGTQEEDNVELLLE